MTVSSISSSSSTATNPYQARSSQQSAVRGDFKQLSQAIKSGDLSAAQSAYDTLTSALQSSSGGTSSSTTSNSTTGGSATASNNGGAFQQVLDQIGQALGNNDISGAQQALSSLQTSGKGMHHHHHGSHALGQANTATTTDSTSTSTTTSVNLTV